MACSFPAALGKKSEASKLPLWRRTALRGANVTTPVSNLPFACVSTNMIPVCCRGETDLSLMA